MNQNSSFHKYPRRRLRDARQRGANPNFRASNSLPRWLRDRHAQLDRKTVNEIWHRYFTLGNPTLKIDEPLTLRILSEPGKSGHNMPGHTITDFKVHRPEALKTLKNLPITAIDTALAAAPPNA